MTIVISTYEYDIKNILFYISDINKTYNGYKRDHKYPVPDIVETVLRH